MPARDVTGIAVLLQRGDDPPGEPGVVLCAQNTHEALKALRLSVMVQHVAFTVVEQISHVLGIEKILGIRAFKHRDRS